jgi:hypothetical protein
MSSARGSAATPLHCSPDPQSLSDVVAIVAY